jgi:hypothetical protein
MANMKNNICNIDEKGIGHRNKIIKTRTQHLQLLNLPKGLDLLLLSAEILCTKVPFPLSFELAQIFKGLDPYFLLQRNSGALLAHSVLVLLSFSNLK